MAETVISTSKLTKRYGSHTANDNISISIQKGDIYGLIGRNGAGKTTLMKMILGLIVPTSGEIKVNGSTNLEKERKKIGSIVETPTFYDDLTAFQNLIFSTHIHGIKDGKSRVYDCLSSVGLLDRKDQKVKGYSLGMRQKLGIANALINKPEILILDEPINGLDPVAIAEIRHILLDLNKKKGTTILISSHILGEMQKISTKYGFIVDGKFTNEISEKEVEEKGMDLEEYAIKIMGGDFNA